MSRETVLWVDEGPQFGLTRTDSRYPQALTELGSGMALGSSPRVRYGVDGRDILVFSVPDTEDMRALISARRVVRLTPPNEPASEWLVSRTVQQAGPGGGGMMRIEADPIKVVMTDAGVVEYFEPGGIKFANLGGINGSARSYLATFVIPHLTMRGYPWIEIGQIDSNVQFSLSWDAQNATQILERLAKEVGAEWQLRRDESNQRYLIDLVDRLSGQLETVEAKEGKNILSMVRQRNRERLYTSIRPSGQLAEGDEERGNLGFATFKVTDVVISYGIIENGFISFDPAATTQLFLRDDGAYISFSATSPTAFVVLSGQSPTALPFLYFDADTSDRGDFVQVEPHAGGIGAIVEDNQHVGLFLESANGTYHEIIGSDEATQQLKLNVGEVPNFLLGDDVMIVADNQGTLISSVESPTGVAQFGFAQGIVQSKHFGYRNFMPRAFIQYATDPVIVRGTFTTTAASATHSFTGLPVGHVIAIGDLVKRAGVWLTETVATGGTVDGSGNVTVTLSGSITPSSGDDVQFHSIATLALQDWGTATRLYPFRSADALTQSCAADGAVTASSRLQVKNVPAGTVISAGTFIGSTSSQVRFVVRDTVADGSGNATLILNTTITVANNDALTLRRPNYPSIAPLGTTLGLKPGGLFDAPPVTWTRDVYINNRQNETVWFTRDFLYVKPVASANPESGEIRIRTTGGTEIVAEASQPVDMTDVDLFQPIIQSKVVSATLATGQYRFEIVTPPEDTTGTVHAVFRAERCKISIGPQPRPFVEGSEATRIFQDGQVALLQSKQWPATYTARLSEIVSEWGLDPSSPALALGSYIRVRAPSIGVDQILRIVAIEYDPTDPGEKMFTLDSDPERISRLVAKKSTRPLFVAVDLNVANNRAQGTALAVDAPPVLARGVERFVVPTGDLAPVTDNPLAVQPLPANFEFLL